MQAERHFKIFKNGRNQALRIPREYELPGNEAVIRKKGARLIAEPMQYQFVTEGHSQLETVTRRLS